MNIAIFAALFFALVPVVSMQAASPLPLVKPEEVGLSTERLQRVHALIERYQERGQMAGAVAVVARRGKLALFEAQGFSDIEARRAARTDDIFRIASMTKPIATVGALMLLEEGKFLLEDPVSKFIPEFHDLKVAVAQQAAPGGFRLVPAEREITIHDLFTHESGLAAGAGPGGASRKNGTPPANLADMVRNLLQRPLDFQPGSAWEYGPSTDVLGFLVEVVSGQTLDQFLHARIFVPLGMNDTYFRLPKEKLARLAPLYSSTEGKRLQRVVSPVPDVVDPKVFSAGGGLVSTPADYVRFCQMLVNGGELEGHRLLGKKTIELMTQRQWSPIPIEFLKGQYFGLGVAVKENNGVSGMIGSPGTYGWSGAYNTYFRIDPKEQLVLILFTQLAPANNIDLQHGFHNAVMQALAE